MSGNCYSEINLHLVWHTKESLPLLTPAVEALAHRLNRDRLIAWDGVFVHAIGGIETHVHVAVTIKPTVLICELVGQLKGGSAHDINQTRGRGDKVFAWQAGYGVVSFGTRDLPWVIRYIKGQRKHHERGTTQNRLEAITEPEPCEAALHGV
jgi:putative transposase